MTRTFLTSSLLLVIINLGQAQDTKEYHEKFFARVKTDGVLTVQSIVETYKRPFSWQKKDWIKFGVVIGVSTASTLLDEPIQDFFAENERQTFNDISSVGDFLGQPENNYPFMLAVWGSGVITNNDWLRDTGIMLFASVTTSGIIQTLAKDAVGRARPGADEGPYRFKPFDGPAYHSFPSGHTMLAVATSWVMAHQVNWLPAKIVFYSIPAVVGISRVYDRAHWFSDIILGSALGIACAETVIKVYPKLKAKRREKNSGLSIVPTYKGLSLVYRF